MDRLLLDLAYVQRGDGGFAGPFSIAYDKHSLYYLPSVEDLGYVVKGMDLAGYGRGFEDQRHQGVFRIELTFSGWQHAAELEKSSVHNWWAFVAMSFDPELSAVYDDGIAPALKATGYDPIRVDRVQHNEKIDDRIIADLRRSGLVIADFTGHKAGVYFECGYAMGHGAHVIWCCQEGDIRQAHFDTRQYNHILWTTPEDLRERLIDRIRATRPVREPG